MLKTTTKSCSQKERDDFYNESRLLYAFNSSPHIVNIEDIFFFNDKFYTFMEHMDGGGMNSIVSKGQEFLSETFIKRTIYYAAMELKALHKKSTIHRDLKSDNFLCNSRGEIKLADLGTSAFLTDTRKWRNTRCTTKLWISPEMAQGKNYTFATDIWSFGLFIHELGFGLPPFHDLLT